METRNIYQDIARRTDGNIYIGAADLLGPTQPQLEAMRETDLLTVDPGSLADINDVRIDTSLPPAQRMSSYIAQIGNPYCYRHGNTIVKLRFSETEVTLEERLQSYFRSL